MLPSPCMQNGQTRLQLCQVLVPCCGIFICMPLGYSIWAHRTSVLRRLPFEIFPCRNPSIAEKPIPRLQPEIEGLPALCGHPGFRGGGKAEAISSTSPHLSSAKLTSPNLTDP